MKRAGGLLVLLVLLGLGAAYSALGYFQIEPNEQAIILRFGRFVRTVDPGPAWHAPPFESVERRKLVVIREEFGFRTISATPPQAYEERPEERLMLTGDQNLVEVPFVVAYRISVLADYLLRVKDPSQLIRDVAQAALRETVARHPVMDVLVERKGLIESEARSRMQALLDAARVGVRVDSVQLQEIEVPDPVRDAFRDVASAEQDRERLILEAQGYAEEVVPQARGEATARVNEALGYRDAKVLRAQGESSRFSSVLAEYRKAPEVTRERLYIETLEAVLPRMEKVIVEEGLGDKILPYLPIGRRGRVAE